jgi:6-phosphogluconolactonase
MVPSNSTRRAFLQRLTAGSCALLPMASQSQQRHAIKYESRADCIDVFRHEGKQRWRIQRVPSANPSFLALDAPRNYLFAVNDVDEYEGLPTGSVESYAVEPTTGRLDFIGRQPLSLSAIRPKHLAVSLNGQYLVVAVYGGGSYNVLPIKPNGRIGPVTQVFKEIGSGPHPKIQAAAHPHSVAFHPSGKFVISTDLGSDRISLFAFESGRLRRIQQIDAPPGSGPAGLYISPDGLQVFVEHKLHALRSCYQFNAVNGAACLAKPSFS